MSHRSPVVDVTGRLRRRRRRTLWRRVLVTLAALVVVGLIAAGVWLVWFSQYLAAQRVEVKGVTTLTTDQVAAAAQVPLGQPLARVALKPIAERVAQLPQVREVTTRIAYPHTVTIEVTERTAAFVLKRADGLALVDELGASYQQAPTPPAGLMVASLGDDPDPALLREVAAVIPLLPEQLRKGTIEATSVDTITIKLPPLSVIWGTAEQSREKAEVLTALMKTTRAKIIDVSVPARPVTR